eukprot:scaffold1548_cov50-Phaeocystis_antarctica.AAC.8
MGGKRMPTTPLGLSNRFTPAVATKCDLTDLSLMSPSGEVEKSLTDAKARSASNPNPNPHPHPDPNPNLESKCL